MDKELIVSVCDLKKSFGEREILKGISFDIHRGDVTCIIGPSGSGKSTLIRCVNFLEHPTGGHIEYKGQDVMQAFQSLPQYRTKVGMVFQSFNLFNNMTVLENCMVGQVKVLGKHKDEAKATALKYLKHVVMDSYFNAKPHQLSGGQKQRVPSVHRSDAGLSGTGQRGPDEFPRHPVQRQLDLAGRGGLRLRPAGEEDPQDDRPVRQAENQLK